MGQEKTPEVLLVGPRVAHMKPHFESRGYVCDAFQTGGEAMLALVAKARDLVVFETQLGDQSGEEFIERARASEPHAAYMLLDDISRAGLIAKTMQKGVHRYLPTPPNESLLFSEVQGLIRAAKAMSGELGEGYEVRIRELQAEAERSRTDATESDMKVSALQEAAQELRDQVRELERRPERDKHDRVVSQVAEKDEEIERLKTRIQELTKTMVEQEERLTAMSSLEKQAAGAGEAETLAAELDERVFELSADLQDKSAELEKATAELSSVREERDVLNKRAEEAEQQRDQLRADLEAKTSAWEEAVELAEQRARALDEARAEGSQASDRVGELITELDLRRGQVEELEAKRAELEEKSIDLELQADDLQTKVEYLEDKVREAEERADEAEAHFKKEKLRLIEEKQDAASGSHEAFQKMEKMIDELSAAKTARAEAEKRLEELQARLDDES